MNSKEEDVVTIDLGNLFYQLWQKKVVIILVTLIFAWGGVLRILIYHQSEI